MMDFLYHALGICGEHNHPHLINLGFLAAGVYVVFKITQKSRNHAQ
jgi:hypothetical protein